MKALSDGLAQADVLVTTGGTSMGASDLLKPVLERNLNGTIHFGRVAMKPGKPTTFASVPSAGGGRDKLVFGLPGNPASALVTFYLFVLPALRRLGGWRPEAAELPRIPVEVRGSRFYRRFLARLKSLHSSLNLSLLIRDPSSTECTYESHLQVLRRSRQVANDQAALHPWQVQTGWYVYQL